MVLNFTQNSRSSKMHPISEKNPNGWMASRLDSSAQRCVVGLPSRACWYEDLFSSRSARRSSPEEADGGSPTTKNLLELQLSLLVTSKSCILLLSPSPKVDLRRSNLPCGYLKVVWKHLTIFLARFSEGITFFGAVWHSCLVCPFTVRY